MNMRKTAMILRHLSMEGPGSFVDVLAEKAITCRYVNAPREDLSDIDPLEPDYLFVMGGPVGVCDAPNYSFITEEIKIIEKRLAADKPTIGVCLGSQLMAKALGAEVYKGEQGREMGWHPLSLTTEGKKTSICHLGGGLTNMFHWHGDTFDLPDGATLLASSDNYTNQIYSYGKNALGIQCHPEIRQDILKEWFVMFVDEITGPHSVVDIEELRSQSAKFSPTMKEQTHKFLKEWLEDSGV